MTGNVQKPCSDSGRLTYTAKHQWQDARCVCNKAALLGAPRSRPGPRRSACPPARVARRLALARLSDSPRRPPPHPPPRLPAARSRRAPASSASGLGFGFAPAARKVGRAALQRGQQLGRPRGHHGTEIRGNVGAAGVRVGVDAGWTSPSLLVMRHSLSPSPSPSAAGGTLSTNVLRLGRRMVAGART